MSWHLRARRLAGRVRRRLLGGAGQPVDDGVWFEPQQIDDLIRAYGQRDAPGGGEWAPWRDAHLRLPAWFQHGLDPWSQAYAEQQHRLWQLVCSIDRDYSPAMDEKEFGWEGVDPVRRPGFYMRRDPQAIEGAGDHVLATGMLLKHCGLKPGDRALEYGAGFGNSALALARMGVNVDTVDISATFCRFIDEQAAHFDVPLKAHHAEFGFNPRPGECYHLIWFYESFHHCLDFKEVVPKLRGYLAEGGKVVLGGEPVFEKEYAGLPYPWGVRLHSEVAVVMRQTRWFELGFSEAFLYELFGKAGFKGRRIDCPPSLFGRLYVFEPEPDEPAS
jgi:2-polyprenyl-3-methyl-5-hydroxy-6-metoxy-1,4-benzoquinol methylase